MAVHRQESRSYDDVDLDRDKALVERCQAGDLEAFDELYDRYHDRLFRFCLRRLRDIHDAEDLTQEAFARAWKALPRVTGERRFYPWLTVIARNLCVDAMRAKGLSIPISDIDQVSSGFSASTGSTESSEDIVISAADAAMAGQAFLRLNDRHQKVLSMRETSGWSYQRIADHEGVAITAVETLLWRARQALRREFEELATGARAALGLAAILPAALLRWSRAAKVRLAGAARGLFPLQGIAATARGGASGTAGSAIGAGAIAATVAAATITSAMAFVPGSGAPPKGQPNRPNVAARSQPSGLQTVARGFHGPVPVSGSAPARSATAGSGSAGSSGNYLGSGEATPASTGTTGSSSAKKNANVMAGIGGVIDKSLSSTSSALGGTVGSAVSGVGGAVSSAGTSLGGILGSLGG